MISAAVIGYLCGLAVGFGIGFFVADVLNKGKDDDIRADDE